MSGVNKVILLGRLGKDPEARTLESGDNGCQFYAGNFGSL